MKKYKVENFIYSIGLMFGLFAITSLFVAAFSLVLAFITIVLLWIVGEKDNYLDCLELHLSTNGKLELLQCFKSII